MDDTAQGNLARQNIAQSAQVPVEEVTPITAETPLDVMAEGADVVRNSAEEVGKELFGGGTTEFTTSNKLIAILKDKLNRKKKPDEEVIEKKN